MAFGQSSGPPATGKQLNELQELLEAAGHSDFRDARGPMGFTQRQAGGKFTRDEADEFIEQLQSEIYGDGPPVDSTPPASSKIARRQPAKNSRAAQAKGSKPAGSWKANVPSKSTRTAKSASTAKAARSAKSASTAKSSADVDLESVPTELLAAELQNRGWVVLEP